MNTKNIDTEIRPGYKQTKLGWIPEEWETTKIGEHSKVDAKSLNGKTDPSYIFEYISLGDIDNGTINSNLEKISFKDSPSRARRVVSKGDVLLATVRPNLKSFGFIYSEKKHTIASTGFAVITCKEGLDSKFLFYNLFSHTLEGQFYALVVGSNYPAINSSDVKHLRIPLPPLPEQQKIAQILSTWDTAIEQSQKLIIQLKQRKKGLMQQLLTGKTRLKGFCGDWELYILNEIITPAGISFKPINDIVYHQIGIRSHTKGIFYKKGVTGAEIGNKRVFKIEADCFIVNIVFAWEHAIAKTTINELGMIASHRFPMYKPKNNILDIDYLLRFFQSRKGKHLLGLASPGGAGRNKTLGKTEFMKLRIQIPPLEEQQAIAKVLTTSDKEITVQETYLAQLQAQKKGLMQQLLTGQKRVNVN